MGLFSVNSPALLTALSVLPFQSTGIMMSMVSTGGVVCTCLLMTVNGRRRHGTACAMEVLSKDGDNGPFTGKYCMGKQKHTCEDNGWHAMGSSAPRTPSPPPLQFQGSPGPPVYAEEVLPAVDDVGNSHRRLGICAFLLGICYEFNRKPGEVTQCFSFASFIHIQLLVCIRVYL